MDQNTIGDAELFMTQNVEIEHLKAELAQAQNQITTLTCLVDKQTQIIRSIAQQPKIKREKNSWSGTRVFDNNKTIEKAAKIYPQLMSSSTLQYTQT